MAEAAKGEPWVRGSAVTTVPNAGKGEGHWLSPPLLVGLEQGAAVLEHGHAILGHQHALAVRPAVALRDIYPREVTGSPLTPSNYSPQLGV